MSGTAWTPVNLGGQVPGSSGLQATGTTIATAFQITQKVSVFTNVVSGAIVALPVSYASGTELRILNRGANTLSLWPGAANQIEGYGIGTMVGVAPGGDAYVTSFDPPAAPAPRTWWLT